ncbi:DUF4360 domain-containing protein [Saccharothrix coeruleofusca]|uniref:DUF4360 domain-containing protein n=1 Tax=Saccharothrix coeruleofusca TaxID=33919 RepID=A0A918AND1_9PSEU|nr:DUF4360 domain-containing protein [Saccharothrix coeruleofusca]MBP2337621.1 hypothetical protein [Saccharothrix coeruleofusca]GGP64617.1 hypothetical protein GCM10010185_41400 [Saccharothrix coeruleofusca]
MLTTVAAAALVMSALIPTAQSEAVPPPDYVTVDVVTVNGSGCPAGTAAVAASPDRTAFTVTYSAFLAEAGEGAAPTDFRKNCQLAVKVGYPQGFTFGVAQADYRGFAHLQAGATGMEQGNYYFAGMSPTGRKSHSFTGPYSDNWQATDATEFGSIVYAPCGESRLVNLNTELRVSNGSAQGTSFMVMDSTDGSVSTKYHFAWKRC